MGFFWLEICLKVLKEICFACLRAAFVTWLMDAELFHSSKDKSNVTTVALMWKPPPSLVLLVTGLYGL